MIALLTVFHRSRAIVLPTLGVEIGLKRFRALMETHD